MLDKTTDKSSNPSASSGSRPAVSMADLMASYKKPMTSLTKGDLIEGTITKLTSQEVLVDINAKTEAVVMEKEKRLMRSMLSALKVGDKVTVSVLNPESDMGHPVVSLRRFMGDASWKYLEGLQKEQKKIEVSITDVTRGGYLVTTHEGVSGFLPNSHVSFQLAQGENPQHMIGKKILVYVLELLRSANKIIFSQKELLNASDFTKAMGLLRKGDKVSVVVTNIASFGVFVAVPAGEKKLDGLVHISEISWEKTADITGLFEVGQTLDVVVIGFDKDGKRVDLSIKRLSDDPFEAISQKYTVDQQVSGTVTHVGSMGEDVELEDPSASFGKAQDKSSGQVAGFIRKEKIPPTVTYAEGDSVKATVSKIDKRKQRVDLVPVLAVKPLGYR